MWPPGPLRLCCTPAYLERCSGALLSDYCGYRLQGAAVLVQVGASGGAGYVLELQTDLNSDVGEFSPVASCTWQIGDTRTALFIAACSVPVVEAQTLNKVNRAGSEAVIMSLYEQRWCTLAVSNGSVKASAHTAAPAAKDRVCRRG